MAHTSFVTTIPPAHLKDDAASLAVVSGGVLSSDGANLSAAGDLTLSGTLTITGAIDGATQATGSTLYALGLKRTAGAMLYDAAGSALTLGGDSTGVDLTLTAAGNVGIGVSPSYKLDVAGDVNLTGSLRIGGTQVLDSSRNASNLGSITFGGTLTGGNSMSLELGVVANTVGFKDSTGYARLRLDTSPTASPKLIAQTSAGAAAVLEIPNGLNISAGNAYIGDGTTARTLYVRGAIANDSTLNSGRVYVSDDLEVTGTSYLGAVNATSLSATGAVSTTTTGFQYTGSAGTSAWLVRATNSTNYTGVYWDGSTTAEYHAPGTLLLMIANTAKLAATSTGVGVGTTTPGRLLQVYRDTNGQPILASFKNPNAGTGAIASIDIEQDASTGKLLRLHYINSGYTTSGTNIANSGLIAVGYGGTGGLVLRTDANAPIIFATSGSSNERVRITGSGDVGIGTDSPGARLHTTDGGALTASRVAAKIEHTATSSTASITKTALEIQSVGTWNGTGAVNRGLYVNVSGGATNYAALFSGGNVGIGTPSPASLLELSGGSLRLPSTGFEGAGQIQCADTVKFANAGAAQGIYVKQISVSDSWADNDTYTQTNGVYSKGNLRVGGDTLALYAETTNGRVGVGTTSLTRAKLEVAGVVGNTVALFGQGTSGVSVVANYPNIGFNVYYNQGWKSIVAGHGAAIDLDPTGGRGCLRFYTGPNATAADASVTLSERMRLTNDGKLGIGTTSPNETLEVSGYVRASSGYKVGATTVVDSSAKVVAPNTQATVLTITAGSTSVTWTHNYGSTNYAAVALPDSHARHVRWTNKTANAIDFEIDDPFDATITLHAFLFGW